MQRNFRHAKYFAKIFYSAWKKISKRKQCFSRSWTDFFGNDSFSSSKEARPLSGSSLAWCYTFFVLSWGNSKNLISDDSSTLQLFNFYTKLLSTLSTLISVHTKDETKFYLDIESAIFIWPLKLFWEANLWNLWNLTRFCFCKSLKVSENWHELTLKLVRWR